MIKTKAKYKGIVCDSCQVQINYNGCNKCGNYFNDGDVMFCIQYPYTANEHYHEQCKPDEKKED